MTTAERRLDGTVKELSARERAILVLQAWVREEEPDRRLTNYMPADQEAEFDRIMLAVEQANNDLKWQLVFQQVWLVETEVHLGWLESLAPAVERSRLLEKALKQRGVLVRESAPARRGRAKADVVLVPAHPVSVRGLDMQDELLWGNLMGEHFQSQNLAGASLVDGLVRLVRQGLDLRAKHIGAVEVVLQDLGEALDGFPVIHQQVAHALDVCQRMLERIHAAAQPFGAFPLAQADEESLTAHRAWVKWDDLRKPAERMTRDNGTQAESEYTRSQRAEADATGREQLEAARMA